MSYPTFQDLIHMMSLKAPEESRPLPTSYDVRGTKVSDSDLDNLRRVLFAEVSNRNPDRQQLEARVIANTAFNRIPQYQGRGKMANLTSVLQEPKQYQGYGSPEYKRIESGNLKPTDNQKLQAIDSILSEIKSGSFSDNTDGRVFYTHDGQGRIYTSPGTLYAQPRTVRDLTQP